MKLLRTITMYVAVSMVALSLCIIIGALASKYWTA